MLASLVSWLELFLQQKIQLLPRGHELIPDITGNIPSLWKQALSSAEPVAHSIERLWQPIGHHAIPIVALLTRRIEELALVVSPTTLSPIGLLYIFHRGSSSASWLGGLPADEESITQNEKRLGYRIPSSYRVFTKVHDGFLKNGWGSLGASPISALYLLSKYIGDGEGFDYEPGQMLAFCGDGVGNEQCYHLGKGIGENDYLTFDWDHEAREISEPQLFWSFLAHFMDRETRE